MKLRCHWSKLVDIFKILNFQAKIILLVMHLCFCKHINLDVVIESDVFKKNWLYIFKEMREEILVSRMSSTCTQYKYLHWCSTKHNYWLLDDWLNKEQSCLLVPCIYLLPARHVSVTARLNALFLSQFQGTCILTNVMLFNVYPSL